MTKEMDLEALKDLPNEFDAEELFGRLIFIDKLEEGRQQAEQGLGSSLEEVESKFADKWESRN